MNIFDGFILFNNLISTFELAESDLSLKMSNQKGYSRRYGETEINNPFSQEILRDFKDKLELKD